MSLPDDLMDRVKRAAGGEGQVSPYVARALADHLEQESLDEILAAWRAESPVPRDVQQQVEVELDDASLTVDLIAPAHAPAQGGARRAG